MKLKAFTSEDIKTYSDKNKRKPHFNQLNKTDNNSTYHKSFICLILFLFLIITFLISFIWILISQNKSQSKANYRQNQSNLEKISIKSIIKNKIKQIEQSNSDIIQEIINKQKQFNQEIQMYLIKKEEKESNNSEAVINIQGKIKQEKDRIDDLRKINEKNASIIKDFNKKHLEQCNLKEKLLNQISSLEKHKQINDDDDDDLIRNDNSLLINTMEEYNIIKQWITEDNTAMRIKLLYRGTTENNSKADYHNAVSANFKDASSTLILVKIINGPVIGGFTSVAWKKYSFVSDDNAFVFNLTNRKKYSISNKANAFYVHDMIYFYFGFADLYLFSFDKCVSAFPICYGSKSAKLELTSGIAEFGIELLEVYSIVIS